MGPNQNLQAFAQQGKQNQNKTTPPQKKTPKRQPVEWEKKSCK